MEQEYGTEEREDIPRDPMALLQAIMEAGNVAELLPEDKLAAIAEDCMVGYRIDCESMKDWRKRMDRGIELAELVKEDKTYPFDKASNVKYPLITSAALQFNARAYPAIVPADQVVKAKVFGKDPQGMKAARAERTSEFMSWQLSSEIEEWEEVTDKLLTVLPIVGTVVRKWWRDPTENRMKCRMVAPGAFVVNAKVKTLSEAPRMTEELPLFPDEIASRRLSGWFRDIPYLETDEDRHKCQDFIEQHCRMDLDEDGYEEPYIVTLHKNSRKVARIAADFEPEDIKGEYETVPVEMVGPAGFVMAVPEQRLAKVTSIKRGSYYIPYHFLPSMDGGFFGTGLGLLLGDIAESINSIINMMIDAGHMSSRGGGFIGSEFRIKGGSHQFRPGEYKTFGAKGADIRNAIVPLTFPGPDATLFQMLGLLIEAGKEVASVKDIMTGDTGTKNMTATTTLALIEQGMMVFTAAYKRIFRSLKQEFKLLARMNAQYLDPQTYSAFHDALDPQGQAMMLDPAQDFNLSDMDVEPVADPSAVTRMQEAAKAQVVMELAGMGMVDPAEATTRILETSRIADVEELLPKPDPNAEMMSALMAQMAQADAQLKMIEVEQALASIEETRSKTVKNLTDAAATEFSLRLDQIKMGLEAVRDGIGLTLGRGPGAMAGASGNADRQRGAQGVNPDAARLGNGLVLGGQALAGGGPQGAPAFGGPMGRPL